MVADVIVCECGEQIGVADHPATSYVDGRELGPLYLTEGHGRPFGMTLWRVGTGDAGQLFDTIDIDIPKPPALLDPDAQEAA